MVVVIVVVIVLVVVFAVVVAVVVILGRKNLLSLTSIRILGAHLTLADKLHIVPL